MGEFRKTVSLALPKIVITQEAVSQVAEGMHRCDDKNYAGSQSPFPMYNELPSRLRECWEKKARYYLESIILLLKVEVQEGLEL